MRAEEVGKAVASKAAASAGMAAEARLAVGMAVVRMEAHVADLVAEREDLGALGAAGKWVGTKVAA